MDYTIFYKDTGKIRVLCSGSNPPSTSYITEECSFIEGHPPDNGRYKVVAGELVLDYYEDPPAYFDKRPLEYPTVFESIDALWHAMDKGILPMVPDFYDPINTVKLKHPKVI